MKNSFLHRAFSVLQLYTLRAYAHYFFRITGLFLLLLCLVISLQLHSLIIQYGASAVSMLQLIALSIPQMLNVIIPFSGIFASLVVLNKMTQQNELIIMRQTGLNNTQILKPVFFFGIGLMLMGWLNGLLLQPLATQNYNQINRSFRQQEFRLSLNPGKFNYLGSQMMFYARDFDNTGLYQDLLIVQTHEHGTTSIIAKKGLFNNNFQQPGFILHSGSIQEHQQGAQKLDVVHFETYQISLAEKQINRVSYWLEGNERFLPDLLFPDKRDNSVLSRYHELVSKGHDRLITPIYFLLLSFNAALFMILAPFQRRTYVRKITSIAIVCFGLFIAHRLSLNLAASHIQWLGLSYGLLLGNILLLIHLCRRQKDLSINLFRFLKKGDSL